MVCFELRNKKANRKRKIVTCNSIHFSDVFGLGRIVCEDSVRRALKSADGRELGAWLARHERDIFDKLLSCHMCEAEKRGLMYLFEVGRTKTVLSLSRQYEKLEAASLAQIYGDWVKGLLPEALALICRSVPSRKRKTAPETTEVDRVSLPQAAIRVIRI